MSDFSIRTDPGDVPMGDPIAVFITWPTYGTWLSGDERCWVEFKHGWQLPKPSLGTRVQKPDDGGRRTNHMHIVIGAHDTDPRKIRRDIKAWCTRRLKEKFDPVRENWWAERGSIRWVRNR